MGRCQRVDRHCLKIKDQGGSLDPAQRTTLTVQCRHPLYNHLLPLCFASGHKEEQRLSSREMLTQSPPVLLELMCLYLSQITDEELLASQHLLLVALSQLVKIGKLVEGRMAACERRGSWQQQWIKRNQLPYIQVTLPIKINNRVKKCFEEPEIHINNWDNNSYIAQLKSD